MESGNNPDWSTTTDPETGEQHNQAGFTNKPRPSKPAPTQPPHREIGKPPVTPEKPKEPIQIPPKP